MIYKKPVLYWIRYFIYLLATVFFFDYIFYLHYRQKVIPDNLESRQLTELEKKAGRIVPYLGSGKKSGFDNFREEKDSGVIRIGCFGDSLTYGDEVDKAHDYPSLLQDIFRDNGFKNVEVINFGIPGGGFHQAFILWQYLGIKYGLDLVVLGPECFQHDRDNTFFPFWETYLKGDTHFFHSRYILKDSDVELIDTRGSTYKEIVLDYWRFIPCKRYLRYDLEAPAFIRAPLACLAPGRKIRNPFYYKADPAGEMRIIYKILLRKMADKAPQVIFANYNDKLVSLAEEIDKDNILSRLLYRPIHFPYTAFGCHNSSWGNFILAQQIFGYATNRPESALNLIQTRDIKVSRPGRSQADEKLALSRLQEVAFEMNNAKIGRFIDAVSGGPYFDLRNKGFLSLLAVKRSGVSILDAQFIPLNFELKDNMPLKIRFQGNGKTEERDLGNVKLLTHGLNIGVVTLDCVNYNIGAEVELAENHSMIQDLRLSGKRPVAVLLGNTPILYPQKGDSMKLIPVFGNLLLIRADGNVALDSGDIADEGTVFLSFYAEQGGPIRIPFANWFKMSEKTGIDKI
ncbi:MAG: hypothetical protein PHR44_01795 [Candidatus Omnitrophica bacterium]|nr:hypothetical protein [Candidatus Omnitrophota bacterium]